MTATRRPEGGHHPARARRIPRPVGRRSGTFVVLLVVVVALNLIGLVMVLSASSVTSLADNGSSWYQFQRQAIWFVLGLASMLVAMRIDYHVWRRLAVPALLAAIAMLVAVLVPGIGTSSNGASRWLVAGPLSVQPSEVAKLALILFAADLLSRRADRVRETALSLRPILVVLVVLSVLILRQPNLGTTLVIAAIAFVMLFVAGVPLLPLAGWAGAATVAAVMLAMGQGYRRDRILAFLDPWDDPLNTGYQTIQSLVGIASGGVWGVGLGAGRAKWGFLPFAHTDFIFAVIAEELGLIGAVTLVALFVLLGVVGVRIAAEAGDALGTLLAGGITGWLVLQAFVNIGAVIGALPITGVPLPFMSAGGSSLVVSMTAVGIMLNVARQAPVR